MQIRSTDPSRNRSIEDLDEPAKTAPAGAPTKAAADRAQPDWDRIPTLDAATLTAMQSGGSDSKELLSKLEKLRGDVNELQVALGPYARECKELHHGLHEIVEAFEMIHHCKDFGVLAPAVVGLAIAKAKHGVETIAHAFVGMRREAPDAVRKAEPALAKVVDDIADIKAAVSPQIDRPVTVRG